MCDVGARVGGRTGYVFYGLLAGLLDADLLVIHLQGHGPGGGRGHECHAHGAQEECAPHTVTATWGTSAVENTIPMNQFGSCVTFYFRHPSCALDVDSLCCIPTPACNPAFLIPCTPHDSITILLVNFHEGLFSGAMVTPLFTMDMADPPLPMKEHRSPNHLRECLPGACPVHPARQASKSMFPIDSAVMDSLDLCGAMRWYCMGISL